MALSKPKNRHIIIQAYWEDEPENLFFAKCKIGAWDGVSNDDDIFYWFDGVQAVVGSHGDFVVVSFSEE